MRWTCHNGHMRYEILTSSKAQIPDDKSTSGEIG
jgi:hypothetical protein